MLRRAFMFLAMAGSAFAGVRWFVLGVTASKWIGLPAYASAMQSFQTQSRNWGISALALQAAAIAISLGRMNPQLKPLRSDATTVLTDHAVSADRWFVRAAFCILGTVAMVLVIGLTIYVVESKGAPFSR